MEIQINDITITLRYTTRAIVMWEYLENRIFSLKTLTDQYMFFYCTILACDKNEALKLSVEEFFDILDERPALFKKFAEFLDKEATMREIFSDKNADSDDDDDGKKKD